VISPPKLKEARKNYDALEEEIKEAYEGMAINSISSETEEPSKISINSKEPSPHVVECLKLIRNFVF